jgi:hypothetical protein
MLEIKAAHLDYWRGVRYDSTGNKSIMGVGADTDDHGNDRQGGAGGIDEEGKGRAGGDDVSKGEGGAEGGAEDSGEGGAGGSDDGGKGESGALGIVRRDGREGLE